MTLEITGTRGTALAPAAPANSNALMDPNVSTPDGSVTEMMTVLMPLMNSTVFVTPPLSGNAAMDVVSTPAGDVTETTIVVMCLINKTAPPSTPVCAVI